MGEELEWFDLAHELRLTVRQVKRDTSSREFIQWRIYKRQRAEAAAIKARAEIEYACKNPSMDQAYYAEMIRLLSAKITGKLQPRNAFYIPFEIKTNDTPVVTQTREERIAEADDMAKMKMFAILGTPANFEGYKTQWEPPPPVI